MIKLQEIKEILETYRKYGWTLQKILLSDRLKNELSAAEIKLFSSGVKVSNSKADGALFSRSSKNNKEAWELRHLHLNPFAIFELIDAEISNSEKEKILKQMENRLEDYASNDLSRNH
ncbi:MAG: hypothetical protein M3405_13860 [Acidobacteriota bacterium]|jgi:hypothetical protein|nr:hypothetical protein [Acidobacteriota bacterium]